MPLSAVLAVSIGVFGGVPPGFAEEPGAESSPAVDVSRVFASWDAWRSAHEDLVSALEDFEALTHAPIETAERLADVMAARDRVYRVARDVEGYLYLRLQLDSGDEEARSRQSLTDETDQRWSATGLPWFQQALNGLGQATIDRWMAGSPDLRQHAFFFRRFFDRGIGVHQEEASFRALIDISARQSRRTYRALAVSEAPKVLVTLESEEQLELTVARARTILWELRSPADRRTVHKAWLEELGKQGQTYAALLEGIVSRQDLLARNRGFESALAMALQSDAIPPDAVRNAIRTARESSPVLRRYHALRKRVLALDEYTLADRFIPLEDEERRIEFAEAERWIVDSSAALGADVQDLVRQAFSDGWIDAVERPGKRPHGGATFVQRPFVLVNYRDSLDSLFQLAHELGHAVHSLLSHEAQPFVYSHPSTLTSEAVAGVFEGILVQHMVARSTSRAERIRVLDASIQNILRLFYRPMLDADFELRLYERQASNGDQQAITGPALDALYRSVVTEYYGETVSLQSWDAHAWQQTPHYYTSPLYMGRYGLASVTANRWLQQLSSPVESEREAARQGLHRLLRSGASAYPLDLFRQAGVNLEDADMFQGLVTRLNTLIDQLEQAIGGDRNP